MGEFVCELTIPIQKTKEFINVSIFYNNNIEGFLLDSWQINSPCCYWIFNIKVKFPFYANDSVKIVYISETILILTLHQSINGVQMIIVRKYNIELISNNKLSKPNEIY